MESSSTVTFDLWTFIQGQLALLNDILVNNSKTIHWIILIFGIIIGMYLEMMSILFYLHKIQDGRLTCMAFFLEKIDNSTYISSPISHRTVTFLWYVRNSSFKTSAVLSTWPNFQGHERSKYGTNSWNDLYFLPCWWMRYVLLTYSKVDMENSEVQSDWPLTSFKVNS